MDTSKYWLANLVVWRRVAADNDDRCGVGPPTSGVVWRVASVQVARDAAAFVLQRGARSTRRAERLCARCEMRVMASRPGAS